MKYKSFLTTGVCVAALAFCLPVTASAQSTKASPSPKAKESPAETTKSEKAASEKPARSIPFHGTVASIDQDAKTFTVGKRTFTVTDKTTVTKAGETAAMSDLTADEKVSGSYWKQDDGTLEARSVKIGGAGDKGTPKKSSKKKKADDEDEAESTD